MDYEKAYTNAVTRAKQAIKDCGHNEGRKRMIEDIFPELADPDRIRQELIQYIQSPYPPSGRYSVTDFLNWLEKQGEQKPTDSYCKEHCKGFQETGKCFADGECKAKREAERNNIVEQLTAFAQHLNKRGAFRDDLCMDFEHEAQSFIELQKHKEL